MWWMVLPYSSLIWWLCATFICIYVRLSTQIAGRPNLHVQQIIHVSIWVSSKNNHKTLLNFSSHHAFCIFVVRIFVCGFKWPKEQLLIDNNPSNECGHMEISTHCLQSTIYSVAIFEFRRVPIGHFVAFSFAILSGLNWKANKWDRDFSRSHISFLKGDGLVSSSLDRR